MGGNNISGGGNNISKGNTVDAYLKAFSQKNGGKAQLTPEQKEAIAKWFQENKTPQNPEKIPGFHFEHTAQMKYGANVPTKPTAPTMPTEPRVKYGANIPPRKKIKIGGQEMQMKYGVNTGGCGKPPVTDHGTNIRYGLNTGVRYRLK